MKSYTDLLQSKKLAEILPKESADMHLTNSSIKGERYTDEFKPVLVSYLRAKDSLDAYSKIVNNMIAWEVIPCWSLAALISVLPLFIEFKGNKYYLRFMKDYVEYANDEISITGRCLHTTGNNNLIDAAFEMILKLHKLKMLL